MKVTINVITKFNIAVIFTCLSSSVWAGRPFFTDDSSLTEAQTCQLETWYQGSSESNMLSVMPACNPTGNFEVTAGFTQLNHKGSARDEYGYTLQGKSVLRPIEIDQQYGIAIAFGVTRSDHGVNGTEYAYVPVSYASHDQLWNSNFSLGLTHEQESTKNRLTWGAGTSYAINPRLMIFGEMFGNNAINPTYHTGISLALIPDHLQFDLTYGKDTENKLNSNFYTAGFSLTFPKEKY